MSTDEFSEAFNQVREMLGLGPWEPLAGAPEE